MSRDLFAIFTKMLDGIRAAAAPVFAAVRLLVYASAVVSGVSILVMMVVTCADVVGRAFGRPIVGALDIVKLASACVIACALPYTTAVKGHVAIEYFFHKLGRRGRIAVDTVARLLVMALFVVLAVACVQRGASIHRSGVVSATLQLPVFWVPYMIAGSSIVVALVVLYNLLHPGKEMIRP